MEEQSELVSVYVITYNSSRFILNTLESIKAQSYKNIELIVSDDCSTDNTIYLCRFWIEINKARFARTHIVTVLSNTGVTANCNRAIRATSGTWLKGIAGDDLLLPNCINDNIEFVRKNPTVLATQSKNFLIDEQSRIINKPKNKITQYKRSIFNNINITAEQQYRLLFYSSIIIPASLFIKKEVYEMIGYNDESIPMMEDRPFTLRATKNGIKFYYFAKTTVCYRIHNNSIMNNSLNSKVINNNQLAHILTARKYLYPDLSFFPKLIKTNFDELTYKFYHSKYNKNNTFGILAWFFIKLPNSTLNIILFIIISSMFKANWLIKSY
jgi:GT2 family glycosyltransferase